MFFHNDGQGKQRYGTVIAALGIDPKNVTQNYLESLTKEFGCIFEKGESLLWVQASEERAEQLFEILRKRHFPFKGRSRSIE